MPAESQYSFAAEDGWTVSISKRVRQSITASTTLTDDVHLQAPVLAAELYQYELTVVYEAANATPDLKWAFAVSTGTFTRYLQKHFGAGPTTTVAQEGFQIGSAVATTTAIINAGGGSGEINWVFSLGYFIPSADATFKFQWAQNASDAGAVSVLENSRLRIMKLT